MPPKGERRKQQIIDTAKQMFINKGFQSTHIGQVCEELNKKNSVKNLIFKFS